MRAVAEIIPNEPDTVSTVVGSILEHIVENPFLPVAGHAAITLFLVTSKHHVCRMFQVQFITHFTNEITYLTSVRMALDGGCRWIQLRMKDVTDEVAEQVARQALAMCKEHGATFVIDDRVELAARIGADGVHLGKTDMPVAHARRLLGRHFIIGGTANTFADVASLHRDGVDYIGCGPFRFTTTKQKLAPILGLEGYRAITRQMRDAGIDLPIVGIGGVGAGDMADLRDAGLTGIALSGSILRADDPVEEMRRVMTISNTL